MRSHAGQVGSKKSVLIVPLNNLILFQQCVEKSNEACLMGRVKPNRYSNNNAAKKCFARNSEGSNHMVAFKLNKGDVLGLP